jgi:hypothetical protein
MLDDEGLVEVVVLLTRSAELYHRDTERNHTLKS